MRNIALSFRSLANNCAHLYPISPLSFSPLQQHPPPPLPTGLRPDVPKELFDMVQQFSAMKRQRATDVVTVRPPAPAMHTLTGQPLPPAPVQPPPAHSCSTKSRKHHRQVSSASCVFIIRRLYTLNCQIDSMLFYAVVATESELYNHYSHHQQQPDRAARAKSCALWTATLRKRRRCLWTTATGRTMKCLETWRRR